jgi:hypothetical protein
LTCFGARLASAMAATLQAIAIVFMVPSIKCYVV